MGHTQNISNHVLYIVPTPVGNLEDITLRAIRILKEADLIVAEDTRTSSVLLAHLQVATHMTSFHKFNEHAAVENLVGKMLAGQTIALISDAGTPSISDPGYLLVRHAIDNQIPVECLPGATAFVPALVASGLPSDKFAFEGFLPVKKGRQTRLQALATETRTIIFYESPHRILKTLEQLAQALGPQRQACLSREISKKFEQHIRGTLLEIAAQCAKTPPKGEIVLTVAPANYKTTASTLE